MDLISVVVPCYNEAECIPALVDGIEHALKYVRDVEYEIIFVDDGSIDESGSIIEELHLRDPRIGVIRFVRNFGHQSALIAGLQYAKGDAVISMDADLQHPPELLPELIERWRSGFDVVQTIRRSQPGLTKSLSSRAFYRLLNTLSEVRLEDGASDYRLLSRRALESLLALPERTRFLRGLIAWLGFPCTTVEFEAAERYAGKSGYSLRKMMAFALDGVVALSTRPLHFALYVAGATLAAAFAYACYVLVQYTRGVELVKGWPSTILSILILGSANLIATGILGLYFRAVLRDIRRRPGYLVSTYMPSAIARGSECRDSSRLENAGRVR